MTKYNWDKINERWNWAARDKNGMINVYKNMPCWDGVSCEWIPSGDEYQAMGSVPKVLNSDILDDWTESLEERPAPPKRYQVDRGPGLLRIVDTYTKAPLSGNQIVDLLNEHEEREQ